MKELFRTNDPVLMSWAEALLAGEGIHTFVLDTNMSIMEGSLSVIPHRVMVDDGDFDAARTLIEAARRELGLSAEIRWGETPEPGPAGDGETPGKEGQ